MSIDTENKQTTMQYTSELQQSMQHTMTIPSPLDAVTTIINANANITTDTSNTDNASTQQLQQLSSTIGPFIFLNDDLPLCQQQPLDLFDKEPNLNQLFNQHSVVTTASSSTTSISPLRTPTPTPSPTANHPPTPLLKCTLPPSAMLTQSLSSPINPIFLMADTDHSANTTALDSCMIGSTQMISNAIHDGFSTTTTKSAPTTSAKRTIHKSSPPGQATMPIRVCAKSARPPRHTECYNCKVTKSPLWRRTPDHKETLCNACGLHYRQYNTHRSIHSTRHKSRLGQNNNNEFAIKVSELSNVSPSCSTDTMTTPTATTTINRHKKDNSDSASHGDQTHPMQCVNCHQTKTPLWRRSPCGVLCNACGLYSRLHHRDRPVKMRKTTIQRRRRDYWNIEQDKKRDQQQRQSACLEISGMASTFSLITQQPMAVPSEIQPHHQEPHLSPTASMASSPDSTTMDDMIITTAMTGSDKSVLDFGGGGGNEEDNTRFASLLVQMDRRQMEGFLGMLEQWCHVVRTLLDLSGNGSG